MSMTRKEAAHVLECGSWWGYLPDEMSDADMNQLQDALDVALTALRCDRMPFPKPPMSAQPPDGAVRTAKLGRKRIWVDENNNFVAEVD